MLTCIYQHTIKKKNIWSLALCWINFKESNGCIYSLSVSVLKCKNLTFWKPFCETTGTKKCFNDRLPDVISHGRRCASFSVTWSVRSVKLGTVWTSLMRPTCPQTCCLDPFGNVIFFLNLAVIIHIPIYHPFMVLLSFNLCQMHKRLLPATVKKKKTTTKKTTKLQTKVE